VEYEGYVIPVETESQRLARYRSEISFEGAVFEDVSEDYDLDDSIITRVQLAKDGTEAEVVIFTVEFIGYNANEAIVAFVGMDLATHDITGLRIVSENDTPGLGGEIDNEEYLEQFEDMKNIAAQFGIFDALSGATVTTDGLISAFDEVVTFYKVEFLGEGAPVEETEAQKLARYVSEMFPNAFIVGDVSSDYTLGSDIDKILEIEDETGTVLGHVYMVDAPGAGLHTGSSVEFMIGINADDTFAGFRLLDANETPGMANSYFLDEYNVQFEGVSILATSYGVDGTAGATLTHDAIIDAAKAVAQYHTDNSVGGGS
jgi:Na+-translocating ferredoxin:NAD+ oxidoreductase RnfG subunit